MQLEANGYVFRVEFSYRPQKSKLERLPDTLHIRGIAVCAIISTPSAAIIALGTAICTWEDQFSRRAGRKIAFEDAIKRCGILRNNQMAMLDWFDSRFPPKHPAPKPLPAPLTPSEKQKRIAAGEEIRQTRLFKRQLGVSGG